MSHVRKNVAISGLSSKASGEQDFHFNARCCVHRLRCKARGGQKKSVARIRKYLAGARAKSRGKNVQRTASATRKQGLRRKRGKMFKYIFFKSLRWLVKGSEE